MTCAVSGSRSMEDFVSKVSRTPFFLVLKPNKKKLEIFFLFLQKDM